MKRIYLDNAATTPIHKEVIEEMMPYLTEKFGNPSSIYSYGREARMAIENVRKLIATRLNARPSEIFFTSGATEAINAIINNAVCTIGCTKIITSDIEHHATLHSIDRQIKNGNVEKIVVQLKENGSIDYEDLERILSENQASKTLICLMHANNEIGNLLDINRVGNLAKKYGAYFFSDTVQTIGHYEINFKENNIDFAVGTAHKFHGPKGVGFIYINEQIKINPLLEGGAQERNMRAGTENVSGIVGMGKAFEIAYNNLHIDSVNIKKLKQYLLERLENAFSDITVNGCFENSLYTVLNIGFPKNGKTEFLEINLDIEGVSLSGGSACSSGTSIGSHVINAIRQDAINITPIRFSFSKYNTIEEIDQVVSLIEKFLK